MDRFGPTRVPLICVLLACAWLAGCVTPTSPGASRSSTVSAPALPALAAPSSAPPRVALQLVRAAYGERSLSIQCAVSVTAETLTVIGLTGVGQRMFTLSWDGERTELTKSPLVPANLDPARLLTDLQLVLWPLESVAPLWARAGLTVTEPFAGVRRVLRGAQLVAEVHYASHDPWHGRVWLVNFVEDYTLTIDSRAEES